MKFLRFIVTFELPAILLLFFFLTDADAQIPPVSAPEIDCNGTVKSWQNSSDPNLREYGNGCVCDCDNCEPRCKQSSTSGSPTASVPSGGSQSTDQMIAHEIASTIMQNLITNLFSTPAPAPGKSQEQLKLEKEQLIKKKKEQMQFLADRDKLAGQLKGKPAATGFFGIKGSPGKLDFKPIPSAPVGQPGNSAWEQLNASSWLSGKAAEAAGAGDLEEASFLSDQAFQAAVGAPLKVKVPPAAPPPASFSSSGNAQVYKGFVIAINDQTKKVVDATREVEKAAMKRITAEKEVAEKEKQVEEIKSRPAAAPGKSQDDQDLVNKAMQELEQSKQRLMDAGQGEEKTKQQEEQEKKILTGLGSMYQEAQGNPELLSQYGKLKQ